jgi:hypothetical protein
MHGQVGVLHQTCLDVVSPSDGEKTRAIRSKARKTGDVSSVQRPGRMSSGLRRKGLSKAALETCSQKGSRRAWYRLAPFGVAIGKNRGVHGAGGARDAPDAKPGFLQQAIEHAPT